MVRLSGESSEIQVNIYIYISLNIDALVTELYKFRSFRRWLPNFDELCSVELLSHKFLVPCDPIKYLNKEYGPRNWETPKVKNYSWTNVVYMANWTDTEWARAIKYYDKNGELIKTKMLNYINSHLDAKHQLNELPPDD